MRFIVRSYLERQARRLEHASYHPREVQRETLRRLVSICGNSEVGRRFGLVNVVEPDDARKLPSTQYADYQPHFDLIYQLGAEARGVLGRSRVIAFGQTSGTTAVPKRFPVTEDFLESYRRTTQMMNAAFFHSTGNWDHLLSGKYLILAARPETERAPSGLSVGFMSGIMMATAPRVFQGRFLPNPRTLALPSWEEKLDLILDQARSQDVYMLAGIPPLVMSFTERALKRFGISVLAQVWPNLRGFVYGGVALSERSRQWFRDKWRGPFATQEKHDLFFWEIYAATEGQFGHSFHPDWPGMVFSAHENFYQFRENPEKGPYLQLHELEAGRRYAIYVTTPGGLVNYAMGDLVEITSVKPLTFRVVGRAKEELSLSGEKITVDQLETVLQSVTAEIGAPVEEYAVWAEEGAPNRLVWGLASEHLGDLPRLEVQLDRELSRVNPTYNELRVNDFIYSKPSVVPLKRELFEKYRNRNLDRGQFKGKRIFRSRQEFEAEIQG